MITDLRSAAAHASVTRIVQRVSLGPVVRDGILAMAALSGDFHPLRMLPDVARSAGHPGLALHAGWVTGLVDAGVRVVSSEWRVANLWIAYDAQAYERDTLWLELKVECPPDDPREVQVSFQVKDQRGRLLAHGSAAVNNRGSKEVVDDIGQNVA